MIIGLDFDGVIVNSPKLKAEVANKLYGVNIPADFFKKETVTLMGLTPEQYLHVQHVAYGTEAGLSVESMEDVLVFLPRLQKEGHSIVVITARTGVDLEIAQRWTKSRDLSLGFIGVGYGVAKAQLAVELGLEAYVDDDPKRLLELVGSVPYLFLFSWRHNQDFRGSEAIRRVASWKEIYEAIQEILIHSG